MTYFQSERLRLGKLRNDGINRELLAIHNKDFHIETIRIRFTSAPSIYPISGLNSLQVEKTWAVIRFKYENYIQKWLINAYLGNTRTSKRKKDLGWKLIGFWDRGRNGFLHCHGFLAFYRGPDNALGYEKLVTMNRLHERKYHDTISDVYLSPWKGPESNAVSYANKSSWRPDSGNDIIYAAVGHELGNI